MEGIKENVTFIASLLALGIFAIRELYSDKKDLMRELKEVIENNTKAIQSLHTRVSILEFRAGIDTEDKGA